MKILKNTPFGFTVERAGGRYYNNACDIFLNGEYIRTELRSVFSVFGLVPNTTYTLELKSENESHSAQVKTKAINYLINVKEYNASGDGVQDDTMAINFAIYTAPKGAVIQIPKGKYCVSSILLKSDISLYLEEGAELVQSVPRTSLAIGKGYQKNYDFTQVTINTSWEGHPLDCYAAVIYGKDVENVDIYGAGSINGNGKEGGWWQEHKQKKEAWRPRNIFLNHCKNITVCGLKSYNSAAWNIHPFYSDEISFYDLTIVSEETSPNTDGLNPESCHTVEIVGCHFSVGDDCIAIKSGKYFMSTKHYREARNIKVRQCLMEKGHGGVVIGSEIGCGVYDVAVQQCTFNGVDRGLRIKTRRGRGECSVVDGISFKDVFMQDTMHCFVVNMFYFCDPDGHSQYVQNKQALPMDEMTPTVRNITFEDIQTQDVNGYAIFMYGLPESPIKNVRVLNSQFAFSDSWTNLAAEMLDDLPSAGKDRVFMENVASVEIDSVIEDI